MLQPKVSVIIPVYNVEKFLADCVQSVTQQTYSNLQIILVDDGSTDTSGSMCDELATKDIRITVIHQKNMGLSAARNSGIDIADGEYYLFVDSDDFICVDAIETLVTLSQEKSADIVVCNTIQCGENAAIEFLENVTTSFTGNVEVYTDRKMEEFLKGRKIGVSACGRLYKAYIFNGLRFPPRKLHEDVYTTYKTIDLARTVVTTDKIGYVYRVNQNSITHQKYSPRKMDMLYGKLEQREYVAAKHPELVSVANADVIYACNRLLKMMIDDGVQDPETLKLFQKLYRKYTRDYLGCRSSVKGKFFALIAFCNVKNLFFICSGAITAIKK